uniref:Uncharacterized protein n=1 Tax=Glossina pallidipes TaxID=7398 RepID=A0A1B0A5K6_GLOPL
MENKPIFKLEFGSQDCAYGQVSRQCTDKCLSKGLDKLTDDNVGRINRLIEEHEWIPAGKVHSCLSHWMQPEKYYRVVTLCTAESALCVKANTYLKSFMLACNATSSQEPTSVSSA